MESERSLPLALVNIFQELFKNEFRVYGAGVGFRVELRAADGFAHVAKPLVGAVVQVREPGLPIAGEGIGVHGVSMVLAGDVAMAGEFIAHGLVLAAVTVLEFEGLAAGGQSEHLMPEANPEDRFVLADGVADLVNYLVAQAGVAGAAADDQCIVLLGFEVGVPREPHHAEAFGADVVGDAFLAAAIKERDGFVSRAVHHTLAYAHLVQKLIAVGVVVGNVFIVNDDLAEHRSFFSKAFGDGPGIEAHDGGNVAAFQPVGETFKRLPVVVADAVIRDQKPRDLDLAGFKHVGQRVIFFRRGNAVVPDEGESKRQNLTIETGICEGLGIANHAGGEHDFARGAAFGAEGNALITGAVLQKKRGGSGGLDYRGFCLRGGGGHGWFGNPFGMVEKISGRNCGGVWGNTPPAQGKNGSTWFSFPQGGAINAPRGVY
jgi:hypothetical protein